MHCKCPKLTEGMSFLWAMSLMRVSGTCWVKASPKLGSRVESLRASWVAALERVASSSMTHSRDLDGVHQSQGCCVAYGV
jgi:hypothetical protein